MGTFLFGCVVFFAIAGIVMFLDRKKEQEEVPTGTETQIGDPVFEPDAATLALAERMKNDPKEFARVTSQLSAKSDKLKVSPAQGSWVYARPMTEWWHHPAQYPLLTGPFSAPTFADEDSGLDSQFEEMLQHDINSLSDLMTVMSISSHSGALAVAAGTSNPGCIGLATTNDD